MRHSLLLAALTASLGGCDRPPPRVAVHPATGLLTLNGKPLANASVVFHPVAAPPGEVPQPRGITAADGRFTLTTYDGNDGAPTGEYRVTVQQWITDRPDQGPSNRLPAKYATPDSSGLTATVAAGPTELKPIELKK